MARSAVTPSTEAVRQAHVTVLAWLKLLVMYRDGAPTAPAEKRQPCLQTGVWSRCSSYGADSRLPGMICWLRPTAPTPLIQRRRPWFRLDTRIKEGVGAGPGGATVAQRAKRLRRIALEQGFSTSSDKPTEHALDWANRSTRLAAHHHQTVRFDDSSATSASECANLCAQIIELLLRLRWKLESGSSMAPRRLREMTTLVMAASRDPALQSASPVVMSRPATPWRNASQRWQR